MSLQAIIPFTSLLEPLNKMKATLPRDIERYTSIYIFFAKRVFNKGTTFKIVYSNNYK